MKVVLSIAGSDSSGGAGIQADIKSGFYHKVFMTTAITAITVQNTLGVSNAVILYPKFVVEQINSVIEDFKIDCIKIGMLSSKELILEVFNTIKDLNIPIILDPVAISRAGSKLIDDEAINSLKSMFKHALLITPNSLEAKLFFNVENIEDIRNLKDIPTNIIFKNIVKNDETTTDVLLTKDGNIELFIGQKADISNTHGTGCSFSASIASLIARDFSLKDSIDLSKKYIYEAIKQAPNFGKGNGPINHILNF
ncbi:bifunctional hydroxymethylpyrimidine kinase/phosphomethylpyrimidine kinase [Arcobacter lanthieri]|uniref:bifunctional hydroxymethylpyrimidine kinase/phosphomethylpyrimidine kinase n=1 Tax=Aliarcobacter lanthieri TaxID=1355374 RepID=UPI00192512BF|nr:bifunctional hydroxymethylpyrimidine kinase/phosphomethylpyrimidine kinase [Aliarcobacter lanthieri]MBL3519059.1 bifunctional hydroxymethylpyrimidine kinase/phosphomethylpyrimidine kinase [Aliarcobacter lanthieri]